MTCCSAVEDADVIPQGVMARERVERDRILAISNHLGGSRYMTEFIVPDMRCVACIKKIENGLKELPVVETVRVNLTQKKVTLVWDEARGNALDIPSGFDNLGFSHHLSDVDTHDEDAKTRRSLLYALAVAGFAAANIMLLSVSVWSGASGETAQLFHLLSGLIAIPAVMFAGRPFFSSALRALSAKRLNMDVPISLAVILALLMSIAETAQGGHRVYFDASVSLLFFLLIGRYLDQMMRHQARSSLDRLSSLVAKHGVLVKPDGETGYIALKEIKPGMILRIFPGERFPVNGEIVTGTSELDRSHVTGESESVLTSGHMSVEAGTLNLTSPLDIEATSSSADSFLAEMQMMMEAAEKGRGSYTRIADRMAQIYAPAVHLLALMAFVFWIIWTGGDWYTSLYIAIAVLIITCPCALGLAVPVAHVIGANRLLQQGILMRDGSALERLGEVDHVLFDKTGTLTIGTPAVIQSSCKLQKDKQQILYSLASLSSHPSSRAILDYLSDDSPAAIKPDRVEELPGRGLQATFKGVEYRLGRPEWVNEISKPQTGPTGDWSLSFAGKDEIPVFFELADQLRGNAKDAIAQLASMHLECEILSGDRKEKVKDIAARTGISSFHFELMPEQKITRVQELTKLGHRPLMVGDGINDAPALAAGHVSMVPASASDVGRQASDFVFTRPSLAAVPFAIETAVKTKRVVQQNFTIALIYNCIAVPLAMIGYVSPLVAAIAMSTSSIAVVANSLRINIRSRDVGTLTDVTTPKQEMEMTA